MRKVTLGLANSLDNYIARKDGGFDWIHWSKEVAEISAKFMKTVDVLLIGRKTYDGMLAYGQTSYPGAKNYVFTRAQKKSAALRKKLATKKADKNVGKSISSCSNAGRSKAATWPSPIGSSAELFSTTRMHFCTGLLRRKSTR